MKKKLFKFVAKAMLVTLTYQLVFPACAYALTTGPSQPEVQSFEPVGTTEMVDMFTGDFNYNIPLMDVEGYPINIFYHSGVGIEQEASWVGLGWNINPGEINRTVRGLPDDFNGEKIEKSLYIKEEKEIRVGLGADIAFEIFGYDKLKLALGLSYYVAHNNYRGISSGINTTAGISLPFASIGVGLGIGTQTGADKDIYATLKTPDVVSKGSLGVSVNGGTGYNSRSGLKDISLGMSVSASASKNYTKKGTSATKTGTSRVGVSASTSIPIGVQNYVPVIANEIIQNGFEIQWKLGFSVLGTTVSGYLQGMRNTTRYKEEDNRAAYGYLYLQNAKESNVLDFSREKDGVYNKTLKNLPASALSYDIYSVNGHGTGGMFRPFRNDIGTIYDPQISYDGDQKSFQFEAGIPGADYGEGGDDITIIKTKNESGQWPGIGLGFSGKTIGSLFENVFFKQAGELTYNQQQEATSLFNNSVQYVKEDLFALIGKGASHTGYLPSFYDENGKGGRVLWNNTNIDRSSRATNISYQTAEQAMRIPEMDLSKKILNYKDGAHFYEPVVEQFNRSGETASDHKAKAHHISEFTQTMPDGRRYVYGIPALNNITREVTFAVNEIPSNIDINKGYVKVDGKDHRDNGMGRDNFYSSTITPTHAHSYLLTALLSNDYVDVLGDGPTDDDLGTYVKYNYTRKSDDYRWRTPYESTEAQYSPGFWSDDKDGKGNYLMGSREQWYTRTIETKNYVAEFYTSVRNDAKGVTSAIDPSKPLPYSTNSAPGKELSYKLDSIKLYNKHDRYINKENAISIKTVIFNYSYQLCKGIPNSTNPATVGKLTLEKIFIKYGNTHKNLLSPYVFSYKNLNNYNFAAKDRWGNYKKVVSGVHNYEFPYTNQPNTSSEETAQNDDLADWNITDIKLPSGGKIHVEYESDDYSFVQDKRSMQMLSIEGVGPGKKMTPKDQLYNNLNDINDYVYFKRRKNKENPNLSLKDNYLEGQTLLYYSFALDIAGIGKFDRVNGYAKIDDVQACEGDDNYAYIKLQREPAKSLNLHPATILGINTGRYHIPHIFYDGYTTESAFDNLRSLVKKIPELIQTIGGQNPFKAFVNQGKARTLKISNSWIRVQTPGLTKKGGGIRVKKLELSDNWEQLSGNPEAKYGKQYDYTVNHERYGKISSGVASYEPMIGADENPFRQPIPYSAESGKGMPSVDFFQEEPFGESFFPPASVGYSSVKVNSIHQQYGRSAQALDEYLFYTAKDYPVRVDYTEKDPSGEHSERNFKRDYNEAKVRQGYCIILNDMHGKPKAVNNYVIHRVNPSEPMRNELITGTRYYYNENANNQLDNNVRALLRQRGSANNFEIKDILLGQDMDITIDSRYRSAETNSFKAMLNVNVLNAFSIPVPVPTFWTSRKEITRKFQSLVTTKIIQQYGILRAVESTDHGAKTTTENLVYDAETGTPLLTRTNNEFNEYTGNLSHPAYLAYEGMRPAYTNDGYEEIMDSLVINYDRDGYLYTNNLDRFSDGDELLVEYKPLGKKVFKLWVLGTGTDNSVPPTPPTPATGSVCFAKHKQTEECEITTRKVFIDIFTGSGATKVMKASGITSRIFVNDDPITCGTADAYTATLPEGDYNYEAHYNALGKIILKSGTFKITKDGCVKILFEAECPDYGYIEFAKWRHKIDCTPCTPLGNINLQIKNASTGLVVDEVKLTEDALCELTSGKYLKKLPVGTYDILAIKVSLVPIVYGVFSISILKDKKVNVDFRHPSCGASSTYYTIKTPAPYMIAGGTSGSSAAAASSSSSSSLFKMVLVGSGETATEKRCGLKVVPRYKDKFAGTTNVSTWPTERKVYTNVLVKVLRSGRRNNLAQTVQQTSFAAKKDNFETEHMSSLTKLFSKTEGILSTSANTFTDDGQIYNPFLNEMDISGDHKYGKFNSFVLGCRGNYRPLASYAPITERSYHQKHVRYDGVYSVPTVNQFWSVLNNRTVPESLCDGPTDLLAEQTRTGTQFWKRASMVTRYDIFGNALEEQDAIGNYSSAQYGYNKALPVSVASNAKYQQFMFEGFEDYNMLLPEKIASLFLKGDLYSAFRILFANPKAGSAFTAYAQNYHLRDMTPSGSTLQLTKEANHTGYFAMKSTAASNFNFDIGDALPKELGVFKFTPTKQYILQLWAKTTSGSAIDPSGFSVTTPCLSKVMELKTGNIDGWYQLELKLDIANTCASSFTNVSLNIPANVYVDDIRALPITANMKSFVYDPISFKLVAQLDENHMATFFEYDQEGLLVRTKKETVKGIVTISESRRANSKK